MSLETAYRVTTFVPPEHLERVLAAIVAETPLAYGRYDQVAWWSAVGTEQFRPLPGAAPTVGQAGAVERGKTVRLEFVLGRDADSLQRVVDRLADAHPWEEPAVIVDEVLINRCSPAEASA
jgi:hypothetical protein